MNDRNGKALIYAAINDDIEMVKLLLKKCPDTDINYRNDYWGNTALTAAAQKGHTNIVKLLLKSGADADIEDKDGETAFTLAAQNGYTKIVKLLKQIILFDR